MEWTQHKKGNIPQEEKLDMATELQLGHSYYFFF